MRRGASKKDKQGNAAPLTQKVKRQKERTVWEETSGEEVFLKMEEELTNAQDAVCNNIRDVTSRYEHIVRVLKTKQHDCHSATSWIMIMAFVPIWLYGAIFVSLTFHTYRKDLN